MYRGWLRYGTGEDEAFPSGAPAEVMNGSTGYEDSTTRNGSDAAGATLQPLHIPAKRPTPTDLAVTYAAAECADPGVIRHGGHNSQPGWGQSYTPESHSAFVDHVPPYNHQQLCNVRDSVTSYYYERKPPQTSIKFWSNSYDAGPSTVTPVPADACQSFGSQTWCNYPPYPGTRVHMEPHTPQPVAYFTEERPRVPGPMDTVYQQTDAYGLRTFPTDVHCPTTYVQTTSGKWKASYSFPTFLWALSHRVCQTAVTFSHKMLIKVRVLPVPNSFQN